MSDRVVAETPYLRLIDRDGWAFVERPNATGVVTIVALTPRRELLFVEQQRRPVSAAVIELPAGLVGDEPGHHTEELAEGARRELEEETGYRAKRLELVASCPTSPGMTNELVTFFLASDLERVSQGGGTAQENITVHEVPLGDAPRWLLERQRQGTLVAAKVYAGLFFAQQAWAR
jgi:ADP-ribose pyrophosphatase